MVTGTWKYHEKIILDKVPLITPETDMYLYTSSYVPDSDVTDFYDDNTKPESIPGPEYLSKLNKRNP